LGAGVRVPDFHCPVETPRGEAFTVGAKRYPRATVRGEAFAVGAERHPRATVRVSLEGEPHGARVRGPDPRRLVLTGREDASAVGGERHARARTRVSLAGGL